MAVPISCLTISFFLWYHANLRLSYFWANSVIILVSLPPYLMIPLCTTSVICLPSRIGCIDFLSKACPEGQLSFNQDTERACVSRTINIFLEMINELPINRGSCQIHLRNRPSDPIYPCLVYLCVWKLLRYKQRTNHSEISAWRDETHVCASASKVCRETNVVLNQLIELENADSFCV